MGVGSNQHVTLLLIFTSVNLLLVDSPIRDLGTKNDAEILKTQLKAKVTQDKKSNQRTNNVGGRLSVRLVFSSPRLDLTKKRKHDICM